MSCVGSRDNIRLCYTKASYSFSTRPPRFLSLLGLRYPPVLPAQPASLHPSPVSKASNFWRRQKLVAARPFPSRPSRGGAGDAATRDVPLFDGSFPLTPSNRINMPMSILARSDACPRRVPKPLEAAGSSPASGQPASAAARLGSRFHSTKSDFYFRTHITHGTWPEVICT